MSWAGARGWSRCVRQADVIAGRGAQRPAHDSHKAPLVVLQAGVAHVQSAEPGQLPQAGGQLLLAGHGSAVYGYRDDARVLLERCLDFEPHVVTRVVKAPPTAR